MDALKKINWKQPKYMFPLIIYFPLLFVGYFVIDLFHTEKAEILMVLQRPSTSTLTCLRQR
jgi:hypothetical protein